MSKLIFVMLGIFLTGNALASQEDFNRYFQMGISAGASHKQKSSDSLNQFKPENTFKNYTSEPSESHYYESGTQVQTTIKEEAINVSANNDTAKIIQKVDSNQQQVDQAALKNETDRISKIQDHAYNIINGISDEFVDCTKQQSCNTTYEEKQCEEAPESILQFCKKTLNIDMIPKQTETHYKFTAHLYVSDHNYAGLSINTVTGKVNFLGPHDASYSFSGRLPANIDCNTLSGKITSQQVNGTIDGFSYPTCSDGLTFNLHFSNGHWANMVIDMVSTQQTMTPVDRWDDGCLGLSSLSGCTFQSEQCVQPSQTRIIQNQPVTRDCWQKEASYFCSGGSTVESSCAPLRTQGCEQLTSVCTEKTEGGCAKYSRTYRCPIKSCADTGIVCNGQTYCLDGNCVTHQKQPDADFQKAVSALSGSLDAAKNFDQVSVFAGTPKSCRNFMLGAAYCCADDGWLVNHSLFDCNPEEKDLGHAKEGLTAHYIGSFEEGCIGDICTKKVKSYCTFPSKLARIIQEQGREQQLGRHFGTAEHPDCSGLTIEELQKINFSHIDFKDFYDDIAKNQSIENRDQLNQRMQDEMKHFIDEGKAYDAK